MSVLIGRLILIGAIASLTACATNKELREDSKASEVSSGEQLSFSQTLSEFKVAWNTLQTGNDTVIEGRIMNIQNVKLQDVDLNVMILDSKGAPLSNGNILSPQNNMKRNDSFAFRVIIKDSLIEQGSALKFTINYRAIGGAWGGGKAGQQTFTVDAVTGVVIVQK